MDFPGQTVYRQAALVPQHLRQTVGDDPVLPFGMEMSEKNALHDGNALFHPGDVKQKWRIPGVCHPRTEETRSAAGRPGKIP